MKIQKATKKDLKEISELFLIETAKAPYKQTWTKKTSAQKIQELYKRGEIYIVIDKKIILGFAALITSLGSKGKGAHLEELWLKKEHQRKGIGTKLMKSLESTCKKKHLRNISLVSDKNSKAFGFYKKLKYKDYPEDALMGKVLG
jgi:ribosomal protein S18 acetylase RimI-like enzyme